MSNKHQNDPFISPRDERERELDHAREHLGENYEAFGSLLDDTGAAEDKYLLREHPLHPSD